MGLFNLFKKKNKQQVDKQIEKIQSQLPQSVDIKEIKSQSKDIGKTFYMSIDDVVIVPGRGTMVVGTIQGGNVESYDTAYLIKSNGEKIETCILLIEPKGDNATGLLLRGIRQLDVNKGDIISATENLPSHVKLSDQIKATDTSDVDLSSVMEPFARPSSGFYSESLEQEKKDALEKVLAEGSIGEKFLLDYLLRDVTISGGYFNLKHYGDQAHMEWVKKGDIVRALSKTDDKKIVEKLSEILMLMGRENQFATIFQPSVAETLGNLKAYEALEKFIASGQNVPAILLSKDILRLHKLGVAEKSENTRDENGYTPLHRAVSAKDAELVKKLLESGADIDVVCSRGEYSIGQTALYRAVDSKNTEIAKLLIEHKANLSAADLSGTFPLQKAAAMGMLDIVKLLIDNGADKQQKTLTGKTALMWAEQNGHASIAALLK